MKKGIAVLGICLIMLMFFGASHGAFCASLNLTLETTGSFSHTDFDLGTAYTYAWHGEILYNGASLGVFNAEYTAQTGRYLTKYDIMITNGAAIPEFVSILVSNKPKAEMRLQDALPGTPVELPLIAKGTIVATSAALKGLAGASVELFQLGSASPYFRITY